MCKCFGVLAYLACAHSRRVTQATSNERWAESDDLATLLLSHSPSVEYTRRQAAFSPMLPRPYPMMVSLEDEFKSEMKKRVALKAVDDYIDSGMVVGLGAGATVSFAVERMGQLIKEGKLTDVQAVPTSLRAQEQAQKFGIAVRPAERGFSDIDVTFSGADELDDQLNLIKTGGFNLQREKMVAESAKKLIVIVDESKLSEGLGLDFPVPVEIVPSSWEKTVREISGLPALEGGEAKLRLGSEKESYAPVVTDNGNYIVDLFCAKPISCSADQQLKAIQGVVEHGLFCKKTQAAIIFGKSGMKVWERLRTGFDSDDGYYQGLLIKTNF